MRPCGCHSDMGNSIKLVICLALPGLALAAFWLWTTRQAREKNSNHGNGTEKSRELKDVANEVRNVIEKARSSNAAPENTGIKSSKEESNGQKIENEKCLLSNVEAERNAYLMSPQRQSPGGSSSFTEQLVLSDIDNSQFSRKDQSEDRDSSSGGDGEIRSISNGYISKESSSRDSGNTSGMSSYTEPNGGFHQTTVDSEMIQLTSHSQSEAFSAEKTEIDVMTRAQSIDEYSDMSSSDSKAESPLDQKILDSYTEPAQIDKDTAEEVTWEVEFPQALCGRLIGKKGKNVQKISQITGTKIRLIPQKENTESSQRLVALTGSPNQLELALQALREKFPSVPFTRLNGSQPYVDGGGVVNPAPNIVCVALPEGNLCQVFVTNIVDANHFYVQLYDPCVQSSLRQLNELMYQCYSGVADRTPLHNISTGMFCAVLSASGWWWRAQVVGLLMKPDEVEIAWLDYGGRTIVSTAMLRPLR